MTTDQTDPSVMGRLNLELADESLRLSKENERLQEMLDLLTARSDLLSEIKLFLPKLSQSVEHQSAIAGAVMQLVNAHNSSHGTTIRMSDQLTRIANALDRAFPPEESA